MAAVSGSISEAVSQELARASAGMKPKACPVPTAGSSTRPPPNPACSRAAQMGA